ncbi:ribose-phosphate pyrophosphokinase 2 [Colletotrichum spaethianum]|uniref:Ribose-phosphate pyrophosphokinase 1 n=1 Tax=Colletotrichum spaethianum TaxID=700344 RepID=A0AA37P861_9PEZI|nr:ribose-phosphate pyrophosphokinase 2 [Colletotrichum spaethianum]GKT47424.1 ribose-phosphate pyrophosphokinase 2 [Colletotrichum spaethianum]
MRGTLIFAGSSCPVLTTQICENLGMAPAEAELTQFSNGETSVRILTSVREKDVFVVQSGSAKVNDTIMELLIMISACNGGSANKITAVLPYFPYSRQSKKKSHRGAITARMLANLLGVAGVKHVITVDLHASQMQGFFKCPVDNLHAEPLIARWIRHNVPNWKEAVVVSKNAGGTKRVTSLADALKLNFGMVTTEKNRKGTNMTSSMIMHHLDGLDREPVLEGSRQPASARPSTPPPVGRAARGHIVDDDYPSPAASTVSGSVRDDDPMAMSHASSFFAPEPHALGGSGDAAPESDEEDEVLKDPKVEHMITLVGDVKNRTVFIVDDMIDKPNSWIAAAETVVKKGHAKKVYCMATHGVFGGDSLEQLQKCECIDTILVTNSFPIPEDQAKRASKLVVLDLSFLLAEAIRRNHYGESISPLYQHILD